jgi:hypothetical protein
MRGDAVGAFDELALAERACRSGGLSKQWAFGKEPTSLGGKALRD